MFQGRQGPVILLLEGKGPAECKDDAAGLVHIGSEELQTEGAFHLEGGIEQELRRGDDPVRPLLLQPRQPSQGLVGDVLPESLLPDLVTPQFDALEERAVLGPHLEGHGVIRKDLAERVAPAPHLPVLPLRHGHPPGQEVVEAGPPAYGRFPTSILGNITADGRSPGARRIRGEHQAAHLREVHGFFGDDPGLHLQHLGRRSPSPLQLEALLLKTPDTVELLGVDDHALRMERHRPPRQPRPPSPGNGLEPHLADGRQQRAYLGFLVGHDHRQGKV